MMLRRRRAFYPTRARSAPIIKPELHRHIVAVISSRQRTECVDPLQSSYRRLIERRYPARLLHANVRRLPGTIDLEVNVDAARIGDPRINLVLHPVVRQLAAHDVDVISKAAAEVTLAALKSEAAFRGT